MERERALKQLKEMQKYTRHMRLAAEEWKHEWQTLIAITMSAQSRDETTIPIAQNLFNRYPTLEKLSRAKYADVLWIFRGLNYNKTKAKNVIAAAKMLIEKFNRKVPYEIEELIELPGVGRKTANVFVSECGKHGLGIDTHVSYISQKLQWTKHSNAHKIEHDLKELFPKSSWNKVNPVLVRFGKTYTSRKKKDELLEKIRKIK